MREKLVEPENTYDQKYADRDYYWGKKPSAFCDILLEFVKPLPSIFLKLLDLGCGEGRNAVYLASKGFSVVGLDLSPNGLAKTQKMAEEAGVQVETILADINSFEIEDPFDVIFSTGTLQYIPPEIRVRRFEYFKEHSPTGGIHALSVFVEKPFIPLSPDFASTEFLYRSGELLGYYWDWEILFTAEEIFDCHSGGIPHKHAMTRMIARKAI